MGSESNSVDPVAAVADDFIARYRRGERPALSEYTDRHPELAERIRQVIPLMVMMEQAGSAGSAASPAVALTTDHHAGPAADPGRVPERIGGFRIVREVGRGGMGVVYEAEQTALGRRVALKVLPLHLARGGSGLERFRREAKAAARLHHSNIVPVYEVGEDGDYCYYAMQFIQGQTLDAVLQEVQRLRDARAESGGSDPPARQAALSLLTEAPRVDAPPRPAADAPAPSSSVNLPGQTDRSAAGSGRSAYHRGVARVGVQAAEALDYAHREGVIHRDIKPSNLLLDADGRVWVADFGLAQTDGAALTQTGDVVGTVRYMAPERFRGWSDPRSDVYSLGLTLYEMLLLRPAFDAPDRIKLIHQVTHQEPARLRKADPRVPRDLETVVHKAMDREPSRRYQTAAELAADLRRFVEDRPILARRVGPLERTWRWGRRNPVVAGLIAAVAVVFIAGFAATAWQMRAALANEKTANDNEHTATDERDKAQKASVRLREARDELHHGLYLADMNLVQAAFEGENLVLARKILDEHIPGAGEADERGFEWYYWQRQCHSELSTVATGNPLNATAVLSPDGCRMAYLRFKGNEDLSPLTPGSEPTIVIVDTATGKELFTLLCQGVAPYWPNESACMCFSDDGTRLAVVAARPWFRQHDKFIRNQLTVWDLAGRKVLTTIKDGFSLEKYYTFALSRDGRRVAAQVGRPDEPEDPLKEYSRFPPHQFLKMWSCDDGKELLSTPLPLVGMDGPIAFSPDGKRIALARPDTLGGEEKEPAVRVRDAATGKELNIIKEPLLFVNTLTFGPDGMRLLASGRSREPFKQRGEAEGCLWDAASGRQELAVPHVPPYGSKVALSPDGRYVAWYGDSGIRQALTVQLWDLRTGEMVGPFRGHTAGVVSAAFSADGIRLIAAALDGTIKTWQLLEATPFPPGQVESHAISLDCRRAAYGYRIDALPNNRHVVLVCDTKTGKELLRLRNLPGSLHELEFSPDGKRLAALLNVIDSQTPPRQHEELKIWALDTRKDEVTLTVPLGSTQLRFRPDGRLIALCVPAGEQKEARFMVKSWDADSGREAFCTEPAERIREIQFTPNGRRLLALAGAREADAVKVWDADTGREQTTIQTRKETQNLTSGRTDALVAAAVLDASSSGRVDVKVWDAETGEERWSFPEDVFFGSPFPGLEFSPDDHRLAVVIPGRGFHFQGDWRPSGCVKLWDLQTGELTRTFAAQDQPMVDAAFSPDGRRLASLTVRNNTDVGSIISEIGFWDVTTGRQVLNVSRRNFDPHTLFSDSQPVRDQLFRFSPHGDRLAVAGHSLPLGGGETFLTLEAAPLSEAQQPDGGARRSILGWGEVVDPSGDCAFKEENGKLTITVPGTVHDLNGALFGKNKGLNAPRVLQTVDGDFTLQVKASAAFDPGPVPAEAGNSAYNGAGLILWLPRGYLRVELAAYTTAKGETFFNVPLVEYWKDGTVAHPRAWYNQAPERPRSAYVRLERRGGEIRVAVSNDGQNWTYSPAPININLPSTVRVGVDAVNTSKLPFTVEFEELQLIQKPEEGADHPGRSAK